ncbi:MAG TPA: hypothetical protein PLM79_04340 [Syntrophobacteraceae bacterium]|nr:hypothetical protein [Syntrophobacteraceae bacterium]
MSAYRIGMDGNLAHHVGHAPMGPHFHGPQWFPHAQTDQVPEVCPCCRGSRLVLDSYNQPQPCPHCFEKTLRR